MKIDKSVQIKNKRARFEYEIIEQYEAGIVLTGTEIKSIRMSKASIAESFCQFVGDELFVINMTVDEYKLGTYYNHKIKRERKLLLHRRELTKIQRKVKDIGFTIVPLKLYINEKGLVKLQIAIGKGKKLFDKRESIKDRDNKRHLDRIMKKG
ncbi:SsrA-binding protein SmpB [Bergeyella zoohelcum]|uniref:SsrA-binding protein n=2 Tax=Bergeyella zoohelcum TaxID=1015 RepID=K1MAZ8_9FLAO|nr:SsrA-binding protein SmpB [Bergeyella zoohelcum]EKB59578.1 SsrA-binding protein [Bergeyella zoohelcum ATCC 43767]EKB61153.1 SsrA-binding protein [Bergeyella zoohelcum CCUG 30536]MDY6024706.1 SsrA-binding protein SmpB [Bergeyella zoohelcum]SSZ46756.1 SsrA-binding protein [Bergeyella zoohelcum]SUV49678.1 SsrA-binding protein [Bergeyella zoohelcum]